MVITSLKNRIKQFTHRYCLHAQKGDPSANNNYQTRMSLLEAQVAYLEYESGRMASLLRHLAAPILQDLPLTKQTRDSFDFQWDKLPKGRWNLENKLFRQEATGYVCQFTEFSPEWFRGKKVIDVGCGGGRYSWALCCLGAEVLSIDQSLHGLERTQKACKDFPNHRIKQVNLLEPLAIDETFDLVWSFGVLHHTGDTYGSFKKIVPLVKPGGYLFMMLYGEPRKGMIDEYKAINEYEHWRRKTRNMTFDERLSAIQEAMDKHCFAVYGSEYIEGYFDAISPTINDLYSWEEVESWLLLEGFSNIKRTVDMRNLHVIAYKGTT